MLQIEEGKTLDQRLYIGSISRSDDVPQKTCSSYYFGSSGGEFCKREMHRNTTKCRVQRSFHKCRMSHHSFKNSMSCMIFGVTLIHQDRIDRIFESTREKNKDFVNNSMRSCIFSLKIFFLRQKNALKKLMKIKIFAIFSILARVFRSNFILCL